MDGVPSIVLHRPGRWRPSDRRHSCGLRSIIVGFQEGESPEKIAEEFPTVTLARVYGAIAYYLENKTPIEEFFGEVDREFERRVRPLSETNPELFARLEAARQQLGLKRT